jgi:hypothetical protein
MNLRRDFSATILDLEGNPVRVGATVPGLLAVINRMAAELNEEQRAKLQKLVDEETGKPLTLGRAAADALTEPLRGEESLDGTEKLTRLGLALMVNAAGVVEINTDQRDKIKQCVNKRYAGALIVGRVWELMEKPLEEKKEEAPA